MKPNLDAKTFRVVQSHGTDARVSTETVFHFRQHLGVVHADYAGGGVRFGKLLGVLEGNQIRFRYVQVDPEGHFSSGEALIEASLTPEGRLRLVDRWQREGCGEKGECVMEEA